MCQLRILIFCNFYVPGWKAGGPILSIRQLVEFFGEEFSLSIVTQDHDLGDRNPYPGVSDLRWRSVGLAKVLYLPRGPRWMPLVHRALSRVPHDLLYLNSFFSSRTILCLGLHRTGLVCPAPVLLAPRGEFSPGALDLKSHKKRPYRALEHCLGLSRKVHWHVTSPREREDLFEYLGPKRSQEASDRVFTTPNFIPTTPIAVGRTTKSAGRLRAVFLSRIHPKKGVLEAITALRGLRGEVEYDLYGPLQDGAYWKKCEAMIACLPPNVRVRYRGSVRQPDAVAMLRAYDLFFMPTRGENFGYALVEALIAGCPLLTSDQTPWTDLESKGVGWDLPLSSPAAFTSVLQRCVDMGAEEHGAMSERAAELGREAQHQSDRTNRDQYRSMFFAVARSAG